MVRSTHLLHIVDSPAPVAVIPSDSPGPGRRKRSVAKKDGARGDLKAEDGVELNSERLGMRTG